MKEQSAISQWIYRVFGATVGAVIIFFFEVGQIVILAAAIIVPIRYFLVQPFIVKGESMFPNFEENDYLIIDEITYRFRDIERGETIVFRPPTGIDDHYIKRVIGLPGETVEVKDGTITIFNDAYPNGVALNEPYIEDYTHGEQRVVLGLDEYFVLGDNRDASLDSRRFGPVSEDLIVGRAWVRGLPISHFGVIAAPEYDF